MLNPSIHKGSSTKQPVSREAADRLHSKIHILLIIPIRTRLSLKLEKGYHYFRYLSGVYPSVAGI